MPINIFGNGSTVCLDVDSTELLPIRTVNTGGVIVTDTNLLVNIPTGLEYLSHTASVGTFDDGTGIWTIPSLGVGSPIATLNICFTVVDDTTAPWVIEYSAVHDVDPDSIPEDQTAERNIDGLACSEFENCSNIVLVDTEQTISGQKTFSSEVTVPDDPYDETSWNANNEVPTKNAIRDKFESLETSIASATPLMYKAIISQVGTADPTATIIYNTLGEVPTFARTMAATYELEVVNPIFTLNKTIILGHPITGVAPISRFIPFSTTVIQFTTHSEDDTGEDLAGTMFVSIEIYP